MKDPAAIAYAGGITEVVKATIAEKLLEPATTDIFERKLHLLGPGERSLAPTYKNEMLQAFFGARFLCLEDSLASGEQLFVHLESLNNYLTNIARLTVGAEQLKDAKTRLQERSQAIGLRVVYLTESENAGSTTYITPRLRLNSPWLADGLTISSPERQLPHAAGIKLVDTERQLAELVLRAFDRATGFPTQGTPLARPGADNVNRWLARHLSVEIANRSSNRLAESGVLGVALLKGGDFQAFEQYLCATLAPVGANSQFKSEDLLAFYSEAGRAAKKARYKDALIGDLEALTEFLQSLDPLQFSQRMSECPQFIALARHATACKFATGELVDLELDELIRQLRVLLHRRNVEVTVLGACKPVILEKAGAHVTLAQTLAQCVEGRGTGGIVIAFSQPHDRLEVELRKPQDFRESILPRLANDPLWILLKQSIPIISTEEGESTLKLVTGNLLTGACPRLALECWLRFQFQGELELLANDAMAAAFHDAKNELLGFESAARLALQSRQNEDRYRFASDASRHVRKAVESVDLVRSLARSTTGMPLNVCDLTTFLRSISIDVLSWIPAGVSFAISGSEAGTTIWSNDGGLRSLILNLARNAVDAMEGRGKFGIDVHVLQNQQVIELSVRDTGPGFSPEQLALLNDGLPVSSSKREGSGVGLLTVLMLARELGICLEFGSDDVGARIVLRVPLKAPELAEEPSVRLQTSTVDRAADSEVVL
jgi:signal transduction histidine kinase